MVVRAWNWLHRRGESMHRDAVFETQTELANGYLQQARELDHDLIDLRNNYDSRGGAPADPARAELEAHGPADVATIVASVNELHALIAEHRRPENQTAVWWAANSHRYVQFRNVTFPNAVAHIGTLPHWRRRLNPADAASPTIPRALQNALATLQGIIQDGTGDFPSFDDLEGFMAGVAAIVDGMEAAILTRPTSTSDDAPNIVRPPNGQRFIDWSAAAAQLIQQLNELELFNRADLRGTDEHTIAKLAEDLLGRIRRSIHPVDRAAPGTVSVENLDEVTAELGRLILQMNRHINRPLPEGTRLREHAERADTMILRIRNRLLITFGALGALGVGYMMLPGEPSPVGKPAPIVKDEKKEKAPAPVGNDIPLPLTGCTMKRVGRDIETNIPKEKVGHFFYEIHRPGEQFIPIKLYQEKDCTRLPDSWITANDITIIVYHRTGGQWYMLDPVAVPQP